MEFGQPQTSGFLEPPMGFAQPEFYRNTVGDIRVPFKGSIRVRSSRRFLSGAAGGAGADACGVLGAFDLPDMLRITKSLSPKT